MSRFAGKLLACVFLFSFAGSCFADGGPARAQSPADHRDKTRGSQSASGALGDTVFLSTREPSTGGERIASFLARELVRQAFLIAARDEFGLSTRDATLGEPFPESPNPRQAPFEMYCTSGILYHGKEARFELRYTLSRGDGPAQKRIWSWKTEVPTDEMLKILTERTEALSRGELKDVIKRLGSQPAVPPTRTSAVVAQGTLDQLYDWNEIAVLGALRKVHAEIHDKGESPELLAALAAGYANLGSLTAYYFSPATKAFSARALLYAERLVRQTDASSWALWHRAYVRAVVGLHNLAAADVAAAKSKPDASTGARPLPFWTPVIEEFCNGNLKKMREIAKTDSQRRLAEYLNLDAVMWGGIEAQTIRATKEIISDSADCIRAWDAMAGTRLLGPMAQATEESFRILSRSLRERLPKVPGLPDRIAKRIADSKAPAERADEVQWRAQLIADLLDPATADPVSHDRMEPSLAALGQCIEQMHFKLLFRRLDLEGGVWATSTEETINTFRPLSTRHRYAALVDAYSRNAAVVNQAAKTLLKKVDPSELGYVDIRVVQWLARFDARRADTLQRIVWAHTDHIFRDEMIGLKSGALEYWGRTPYLRVLNVTSSKLPDAAAVQIDQDWNRFKDRGAQLEKDYAEEPAVMAALTRKYMETGRLDDAERCAKERVRLLPDFAAYSKLASIYKKKGELDRWKATLVKSLELPSLGLESAQVRVQIAEYHMGRKEWKEALPFADEAAESYAAWALLTAARCHEMLGHWSESEKLMRATAERYNGEELQWLIWCRRTGHGDLEAAKQLSRNYVESFGPSPTVDEMDLQSAYHMLANEPVKAVDIMKKAYQKTPYPYFAMSIALAADARGDAAERDDYFKRTIDAGKKAAPNSAEGAYARLVQLLEKTLPPGSAKDFDPAPADEIIASVAAHTVNMQYFVGAFLRNHGNRDKGRDYLERCVASPVRRYCRAYAAQALRELKDSTSASEPGHRKEQN